MYDINGLPKRGKIDIFFLALAPQNCKKLFFLEQIENLPAA